MRAIIEITAVGKTNSGWPSRKSINNGGSQWLNHLISLIQQPASSLAAKKQETVKNQ